MATFEEKTSEVKTSITFNKIIVQAVIKLLRAYQLILSPLLGANCRFYPSCSSYTIQAIETFGLIKGSYLAVKRISKCHPWHPGGIDEVPTKTTQCCKSKKSELKHHG
jgi:hypothetical protein